MRIVIDSNVRVSAMLSPHGPPAPVVRLAFQGTIGLLHDDGILAEYREVLGRLKSNFEVDDIQAVIAVIERIGETVFAGPLRVESPDDDDLPFLEVAAAARADSSA
jgi:putative PIN family toxin of toxin-antitoxin system